MNQKNIFKNTYFNQFKNLESFLTSNLSKNLYSHSPDFFTVHLSYGGGGVGAYLVT